MEPKKPSLGQRWTEARPTKTSVFWACVASVVLTLIVGFTWGGWVRGATAKSMADTMAEEAVAKRLAPMCVAQVSRDPAKDQKLKEMREKSSYERGEYVKAQGWAKMPGDTDTDAKVAEQCARLLTEQKS
jgi:hypothetical protein